jgi:hypothetical protein
MLRNGIEAAARTGTTHRRKSRGDVAGFGPRPGKKTPPRDPHVSAAPQPPARAPPARRSTEHGMPGCPRAPAGRAAAEHRNPTVTARARRPPHHHRAADEVVADPGRHVARQRRRRARAGNNGGPGRPRPGGRRVVASWGSGRGACCGGGGDQVVHGGPCSMHGWSCFAQRSPLFLFSYKEPQKMQSYFRHRSEKATRKAQCLICCSALLASGYMKRSAATSKQNVRDVKSITLNHADFDYILLSCLA